MVKRENFDLAQIEDLFFINMLIIIIIVQLLMPLQLYTLWEFFLNQKRIFIIKATYLIFMTVFSSLQGNLMGNSRIWEREALLKNLTRILLTLLIL